MLGWIYIALLVFTVGIAIRNGGADEQIAAAALFVGSVVTIVLYSSGNGGWLTLDAGLFANEIIVTAALLFVALRSTKNWPLLIAAWQMLAMLTPIAALWGQDLASYPLGVAQGFWAYPQLLLLIAVSVRRSKDRKALKTTLRF